MAGAVQPWCPPLSLEEPPPFWSRSPWLLLIPPRLGRADALFARHLVPEADCRLGPIVLVPHDAQAGPSEQEVPARARVESKPARSEHSEKVPAREEQGVAFDGAHPAHHPGRPRPDLVRRLSSPAAVAEQLPVGPLAVDVRAGATFVGAVVPFDEIRLDLRHGAEAGQLTRADRPL